MRRISELKDILNVLEDAQARISTVILCNPKQKEVLEKVSINRNNVYLIEDCHVELNKVIIVEDLEMKKMLISNYKRKEQQNETNN